MTHYFIFADPEKDVSFTFCVDPVAIAKMNPKTRGKTLSGLDKNLGVAGKHIIGCATSFSQLAPFSDFRREVLDFATSEIGQTGPTQ